MLLEGTQNFVLVIPITIEKELSDQKIYAGNSATFEVQLSSETIDYKWLKNGHHVEANERIHITSEEDTYRLVIDFCTPEDEAQYAFVVGKEKSSAKLTINSKSFASDNKIYLNLIMNFLVINLTGYLNNQSEMESHKVQLECSVDVENYEDGIWLHERQLVEQSDKHYRIETIGHRQKLIIDNVREEDGGNYAYLTGSGDGTEAILTVIAAHISKPMQNIAAAETSTATFVVHVSHDGLKGEWFKNNEPIQVFIIFALIMIYILINSVFSFQTSLLHILKAWSTHSLSMIWMWMTKLTINLRLVENLVQLKLLLMVKLMWYFF